MAAAAPVATGAFSFHGSPLMVLPIHLLRLLVLGALCVMLPFGLGQAAILEVRAFLTPVGLGGVWESVAEALRVLPLLATGFVSLLLVGLWVTVRGWLQRYRIMNTHVLGQPLAGHGGRGCNPIPGWLAAAAVLFSLGLATPWVRTWQKRRQYAGLHTAHGPLSFAGTGLEVAKLGLLTVCAFPLVVGTFGLASIPLRFYWLRWEQSRIGVPVADGQVRTTRFTGTLTGYCWRALKRWVLTVVTLGLHRPWGLVAAWRYQAEHTELVPLAQSPPA